MDEATVREKAAAAGLVAVQAYVPAEPTTRKGGAERVARHREKLKEAGLVQATVPRELLAEVEAAGGWKEWRAPPVKGEPSMARGWRGLCVRIGRWLIRVGGGIA